MQARARGWRAGLLVGLPALAACSGGGGGSTPTPASSPWGRAQLIESDNADDAAGRSRSGRRGIDRRPQGGDRRGPCGPAIPGSVGKVDARIIAVTGLRAGERLYYPLHVEPCTPASRVPPGNADPAFRTKPQIARELIARARAPRPPLPGGRGGRLRRRERGLRGQPPRAAPALPPSRPGRRAATAWPSRHDPRADARRVGSASASRVYFCSGWASAGPPGDGSGPVGSRRRAARAPCRSASLNTR